jgi:hypothetical protein
MISFAVTQEAGKDKRAAEVQAGADRRNAATIAGAKERTQMTQEGADRRNASSQAGADRRAAMRGKKGGLLGTGAADTAPKRTITQADYDARVKQHGKERVDAEMKRLGITVE